MVRFHFNINHNLHAKRAFARRFHSTSIEEEKNGSMNKIEAKKCACPTLEILEEKMKYNWISWLSTWPDNICMKCAQYSMSACFMNTFNRI